MVGSHVVWGLPQNHAKAKHPPSPDSLNAGRWDIAGQPAIFKIIIYWKIYWKYKSKTRFLNRWDVPSLGRKGRLGGLQVKFWEIFLDIILYQKFIIWMIIIIHNMTNVNFWLYVNVCAYQRDVIPKTCTPATSKHDTNLAALFSRCMYWTNYS